MSDMLDYHKKFARTPGGTRWHSGVTNAAQKMWGTCRRTSSEWNHCERSTV